VVWCGVVCGVVCVFVCVCARARASLYERVCNLNRLNHNIAIFCD
jgi:hypothetical protein